MHLHANGIDQSKIREKVKLIIQLYVKAKF